MPTLTKKPGQVAGLREHARAAPAVQCTLRRVADGARFTGAKPKVLGPVAHAPPGRHAERRRQHRQSDEHAAPRRLRDDPRQRRAGDHGAEVAGEHRHAVQRREAVRREPHGGDLQDRDERDRHADADQRAAGAPRPPTPARARTASDPAPATSDPPTGSAAGRACPRARRPESAAACRRRNTSPRACRGSRR